MPDDIANVLSSKVDATSERFEKNMRAMADRVAAIHNEEEKIREGGGAENIEKQHKKKRLTARERIALLLDPKTEFFELGIYSAFGMYEEWGGAPALLMLIVNDATVKAGAFFPMTAKKVIRAQNIAIENRIPTIYLVEDRKSVV